MRNSILITLYMADNENYWLLFFLIRKINARINIAKSTNPHNVIFCSHYHAVLFHLDLEFISSCLILFKFNEILGKAHS